MEETKIKKCVHCKKDIDLMAMRCPFCQGKNYVWTTGKKITGVLIGVVIFFIFYSMFSGPSTSSNSSTVPSVNEGPKLELLSYDCSSSGHGFFTVSGQVKNISGESMKNVEAVLNTYTDKKEFVNSDSALIEYDPILAGQTSPFKVIMTDNPEMKKCSVDFKYLMGGTIEVKDSAK